MDLRSRLVCSFAWVVLESGLGNGVVGEGIQGKAGYDTKGTRVDHLGGVLKLFATFATRKEMMTQKVE